MTIYAVVWSASLSSSIIIAFAVVALVASIVEIAIDARYPPARHYRQQERASGPAAMELTSLYYA